MTNAPLEAGVSIPGNIFLVGLMGAGKTSVGRMLAKHLQKSFVDSDHEIEHRTGVKIPVIFEVEGEAGFRSRETAVLRELSALNDIVLATGGGAVLNPENRKLLKERGVVIYLRGQPDDLWLRTRHDHNRPLLQTVDPLKTLETLFQQRDPLYQEIADITVNTGKQNIRALEREIEKRLSALFQAGVLAAPQTINT